MSKSIAVWIDHVQARVIEARAQGPAITTIESGIERPTTLHAHIRHDRARFIAGLLAGAAGLGGGAALLPMFEGLIADHAILGAVAALSAAAIILPLPLPRHRPGHCIYCAYDLRNTPTPGQPGAGLCPECGRPASV